MAALTTKPSSAPKYVSPGVYRVNGATVQAKNAAAASAASSKTAGTTTKTSKAKAAKVTPLQAGYNNILLGSNQAQNNLFGQINQQQQFTGQTSIPIQQFNPGNFQDQYRTSYDATMNEFDRTNQRAFDKQNRDYQQMAAERGWDPNSEVARSTQRDLMDSQNNARQGAANQAVAAGMAAQNQGYTQNSNTYGNNLTAQGQQYNQGADTALMPYKQLGALQPYFGTQAQTQAQEVQNKFTHQEAESNFGYQQYLQAHAKSGGGGGGGDALTFDQRLALQRDASDNALGNALAAQGMSGGQGGGGVGNAAVTGLAAGFGAGLAKAYA